MVWDVATHYPPPPPAALNVRDLINHAYDNYQPSKRNSNDDEVTIVESNPNGNQLKHLIWLNQLRWWFIRHTQPSCPINYLHYVIIHTLYLFQGWVPSIGDHWTLPCSFSSLLAPQPSVVLFLLGITYAKQKIWHMYWEKESHMTNDTSGSNKNHWWGCDFAYENMDEATKEWERSKAKVQLKFFFKLRTCFINVKVTTNCMNKVPLLRRMHVWQSSNMERWIKPWLLLVLFCVKVWKWNQLYWKWIINSRVSTFCRIAPTL